MKDYTGGAVRRPGTETKKTKVSVAADPMRNMNLRCYNIHIMFLYLVIFGYIFGYKGFA